MNFAQGLLTANDVSTLATRKTSNYSLRFSTEKLPVPYKAVHKLFRRGVLNCFDADTIVVMSDTANEVGWNAPAQSDVSVPLGINPQLEGVLTIRVSLIRINNGVLQHPLPPVVVSIWHKYVNHDATLINDTPISRIIAVNSRRALQDYISNLPKLAVDQHNNPLLDNNNIPIIDAAGQPRMFRTGDLFNTHVFATEFNDLFY